ncbi:unnamed protein product [Paramecium primaurelia]|uniref:Uncharacterized protein n=2 Tax=Paramecium TaxID=5884 RepID=A0A8S1UMH2_9CILI|nr:unnamed protein product [Paramecium primaurelia]CAD8164939.1 unnamed protein product [Paramecium pentaurelia]
MNRSQQQYLNKQQNYIQLHDQNSDQLQENLERLSNLMIKKPSQVKKVFVQMHGYLRSPSANLTMQTRDTPASKLKSIGQVDFEKSSDKIAQQLNTNLRNSSLNVTNHYLENSNLNFNQTQKPRNYNSWIGLSVIERNKIFMEEKEKKLKKLKEQKEENEISQCTFAPAFFNPIRVQRNKSCQVNKSYQDIHQQKKLHNSRLY